MIFTMLLCTHISVCFAGLVGGNPSNQFLSNVPAAVGQRVVLPCQSTIEDSDSGLTFFWYRQLRGEALTFLIQAFKDSGNDKFRSGKFSVVVYKNETAPLEIAKVSFEDTAIYYCALMYHIKLSHISTRAKSALRRTAQEG
uniref:Ig-like domain-containing protein n=1 Tax=Amazona collaria TaxID=241587 RepID=A0A8B9GJ87_9PSIT